MRRQRRDKRLPKCPRGQRDRELKTWRDGREEKEWEKGGEKKGMEEEKPNLLGVQETLLANK